MKLSPSEPPGQSKVARELDSHQHRCRFCSSGQTKPFLRVAGFYHPDEWTVWRCAECGVQFIDAEEHSVNLETFYDQFYAPDGPAGADSAEGLVSPWRWRRQVRILMPLLGRSERHRVIDIGCNSGQFLLTLPGSVDRYGVERSQTAAARASASQIRVHRGAFQRDLYPESFFSGVCAFAIIEHLLDPSGFLSEVRRVLKNGGVCVLMTGDPDSLRARFLGRRWRLYTPPSHQFFFPARSLDARMKQLGFTKIAHFYSAGGMVGPAAPLVRFPLKVLYAVAEMMPLFNRLPVLDHYYAYYRLTKPS